MKLSSPSSSKSAKGNTINSNNNSKPTVVINSKTTREFFPMVI